MFLHLSRSSKCQISVDRSGRVVAKRLHIQPGPQVADSAPLLDRKASGVVLQILASVDSTKIPLSLLDKNEVWEVETSKTIVENARSKDQAHWRWTQTTSTSIPLIYFFNGKVTLCDWDSIELARQGHLVDSSPAELGSAPVAAIMFSNNGSHICILIAGSRLGVLQVFESGKGMIDMLSPRTPINRNTKKEVRNQ